MPVILEDLDLSAITVKQKSIDPKFFSSKLTGSGKATGLLNQNFLCVNNATNTAYRAHDNIEVKSNYTQFDITTSMIPMAPLTRRALTGAGDTFTLAVPHVDDRFALDLGSAQSTFDAYFFMTPQAAVLYQDGAGDKPKRDLVVQYRMELFFIKKNPAPGAVEPERALIHLSPVVPTRHDASVVVDWNTSPLTEATDWVGGVLAGYSLGSVRNTDAFDEWLRDYSVYEHITRQAQCWDSGAIADEVNAYIDEVPTNANAASLNALAEQLRYLENYNIPLDAYRAIHKKLESTFPDDVAGELSKQNLNLLMNHTLDHLDRMRTQLAVPAQPASPPVLPAHLSKQQLDALTTHEPLVMTQAGAGTGKSTVILQRIDYLQACGVNPADITVLSFTNAAADNILAKNPHVGSMTIARMIHDIYSLNHPTHELSSIDTIINSIDIFYPNSAFAAQFRTLLLKVDKNESHAFTMMNTFIENHYDDVMGLLDQIKQTSLELEIIVCYQQIDKMVEPPHVQCRFLIIDEVQDNSIFEFIYMLKYVSKHAQSLFIVGDASQTLYEFRSANPRALNTLESSGVFATFKLTTNYRSNQEILDFANVVLGHLETNQFANIQLQANSLNVPTAQSFKDKVIVDYREVRKKTGFITEELPGIMRATICPNYVDACLARGEQVAFLAYSRREAAVIQTALEEKYPNRHVANLISEKVFATDVFSKYIKFFWNDVLQVQPGNASFVVAKGIVDNLDKLTRNSTAAEQAIKKMVQNWWLENSATINAWVTLCNQRALSNDEFFERLRDNLLSFEIRHNAVRQSLMNQKNRERKVKNAESKSDLVVSTIHGAKGLEFDNVVVLHKEDTQMSEDNKRMYYVAFTRAMNTQYVLSYGTVKNAPIESNYTSLVAALETRDAANIARASGIDLSLLDDDDATGASEEPVGSV